MPDIVLYNRTGQAVTYPGADTLRTDTPEEGKTAVFTYGELLEGTQLVPDFSGGDHVVTVPEGYLVREATVKKPENHIPENIRKGVTISGVEGDFIGDTEEAEVDLAMADGDQVIEPSAEGKVLSKVTVKKPETLVPENIAKDVDIAGVIGALVGAKVAYGTFTPDVTRDYVINHNLGCVPDLIFVRAPSYKSGYALLIWGTSQAFYDKYPTSFLNGYFKSSLYSYIYGIDNTSTSIALYGADETTVTIGNVNLNTSVKYSYIAIGGLT